MTHDTMEPTPEFRDHLERTVVNALRLEQQLDNRKRAARTRWMGLAAIIVVSVGLGATAGIASGQIRDSARRDSLLEAARADASLAAIRLNVARERLADAKRRYDVGAGEMTSVANADAELRAMEARAVRARYNIEEITASSQPPRDELSAPLVGGRDFVKDRIMLDLAAAQERLTTAEKVYSETERRARVGAASDLAIVEANVEVTRARSAMAVLAQRMVLRKEFVERGTPIDQLTARLANAELQQDIALAQEELTLARKRVEQMERQRAAGVGTEFDLIYAKLNAQEREMELQKLMLRYNQRPR